MLRHAYIENSEKKTRSAKKKKKRITCNYEDKKQRQQDLKGQ